VMKKIEKYFADIPQQAIAPEPDVAEPKQIAERRNSLEDPLAQLTRLDIVYKIPRGNTPDAYALDYISDVLSNGQSSRLYRKLVKEKELVTSASCSIEMRRGPGLFWCTLMVRPGRDPVEVERALYEELDKLKNEPISDAEVEKERLAYKLYQARQLQSTLDRATTLGMFALFFNDPDLINTYSKKLLAVTKSQLQEAAGAYLVERNRSVVLTTPARPKPEEPNGTKAVAQTGQLFAEAKCATALLCCDIVRR
jgi:zinc protease